MTPEQDLNPAGEKSSLSYEAVPVKRAEHSEGSFTRLIEQQTAKIPSDFFLFMALAAMGASLVLQINRRLEFSRFVGMWAPTLLIMGVYNKLVKTLGPR